MNTNFVIKTLVLCCWLTGALGQLTWHVLHSGTNASLAPAPRRDAGLAYYDKRNLLVMYGGRSEVKVVTTVMSDTWIFDINQKRWREVSSTLKPSARFSFVYGQSGIYFYIATGEGPDRTFYDDIWRFNIEEEEWESLPPQARPAYYTAQQWSRQYDNVLRPAVRYGAAGGIFPNTSRFYVTHGFSTSRHADTMAYDLNERGWYTELPECTQYSPSCPHARCLHSGVMISAHELLIFGGCLSGGGSGGLCPASDTWVYNARTKLWLMVDACPVGRTLGAMAMLPIRQGQRRAILYGGVEKTRQVINTVETGADEVAVFNPELKAWTIRKAEGAVPSKRASAAMATGPNGVFMFGGFHMEKQQSMSDLYLLLGDSSSVDFAPKRSDCRPTFLSFATVHGILMALGWGFFLQWGAFIARYFKHKEPLWLHLHRLFQVFGLIVVMGGFVCAILSVQFDHFKFTHAILGVVVMVMGLQQPLNALCRPRKTTDQQEKKLSRALWEIYHVTSGRLALLGGLVNVSLGLLLIGSHKLVLWLWCGYVGLLVLAYLLAELRKRLASRQLTTASGLTRPDTYRANKHQNGSRAVRGYDNPALNVSDKL